MSNRLSQRQRYYVDTFSVILHFSNGNIEELVNALNLNAISGEGSIVLEDSHGKIKKAVDLPLDVVLGKIPPKV